MISTKASPITNQTPPPIQETRTTTMKPEPQYQKTNDPCASNHETPMTMKTIHIIKPIRDTLKHLALAAALGAAMLLGAPER